jgi:hypothetical protein
MCRRCFRPVPTNFAAYTVVDGHHNQHHSTPNQLLWSSQESEFRESAWPLYSIYSNIADDEINKMVERCQRNTNGILIFVSSHVSPQMTLRIIWEV